MNNKRIASIDIGTNTLLALIAEYNNENISTIYDYHSIPRLGEKLKETGVIAQSALERALVSAQEVKNLIAKYKVDNIKAVATSAMREAQNAETIKSALENAIGCEIEIISGEQEAVLTFLGSIEDNLPSSVIDIGGGSTEFIFGHNSSIFNSKSIKIGAVKMYEMFFEKSFDEKAANDYINLELDNLDGFQFGGTLYSVAGTPTSMASIDLELYEFDAQKVHLHQISIDKLKQLTEFCLNTDKKYLVDRYGIHPNRVDLLRGGSLILYNFAKRFSFNSITVSTKGLRYGVGKTKFLEISKKDNL